jgi:hypothetical protein
MAISSGPKEPKRKRGGSKPKPVCKNGHDISEVGRNSSGNCRKCRQEYDAVRREFIRKHFNEKLS